MGRIFEWAEEHGHLLSLTESIRAALKEATQKGEEERHGAVGAAATTTTTPSTIPENTRVQQERAEVEPTGAGVHGFVEREVDGRATREYVGEAYVRSIGTTAQEAPTSKLGERQQPTMEVLPETEAIRRLQTHYDTRVSELLHANNAVVTLNRELQIELGESREENRALRHLLVTYYNAHLEQLADLEAP